jgi:hypothetical protein
MNGEGVLVLPPIAKGTLNLDKAPRRGKSLSGSYSISTP